MQTHQRIWLLRKKGKIGGIERVHLGPPIFRHFIVVVAVLGLVLVGSGLGTRVVGVFARSPCSSGDQVYFVASGDTLGGIATRYHTTCQRLAKHGRFTSRPLFTPLSKALVIIFLTASVHGGQAIAIFSYTVSMSHGKRKQMPGNGQLALETSTGIFLTLLRRARL